MKKTRWLFRFYDSDRDGFISRDEFTVTFNAIQRIAKGEADYDTEEIFKGRSRLGFSDFEEICRNNSETLKKMSLFRR